MIDGGYPDGVLVPLMPKTDYDFGWTLGLTYDQIVVDKLYTVGFSHAVLLLRLHSRDAASSTSAEVLLLDIDPSDEDGQNFVVDTTFLSVSVTEGTTVPKLIKSPVGLSPGPCLRAIVRGKGPSVAGKAMYTISADLLLRRAPDLVVVKTHHSYTPGVSTLRYIPLNSTTSSATITDIQCGWLAPADGELVEVLVQTTAAAGNPSTVGLHTNGNTTPVESIPVNMASANQTYVFKFTKARFNRGDRLHVSFDPNAVPTNVFVECRWRYSKI